MRNRGLLFSALLALFAVSCNNGVEYNDNCSELFKPFNSTDLGKNVFVFDPGMDMNAVQQVIDTLYYRQVAKDSEFNSNRYSLLFRPGTYKLDVRLGYYMQAMGLGKSPEDVVIDGAVRSLTTHHGNVLCNFWRGAENLTVIPSKDSVFIWGVSQASPMRRLKIKGNLNLFHEGYASGGYMADTEVDGIVYSGPQQQWFTRNSNWKGWEGGVWNMFFMGVSDPPAGEWPEKPYTVIENTPVVREKPFLISNDRKFSLAIPPLTRQTKGVSWKKENGNGDKTELTEDFYIATADRDDAQSINKQLLKGKDILITPGRYELSEPLFISKEGTVVLGLGMPTLIPLNGTSAVAVKGEKDIVVAGLTIDAGATYSESLFVTGELKNTNDNSSNPVTLSDIFFRVGGHAAGSAGACLVINSNSVLIDHVWLWRADHGNGVGWDLNKCRNGLVVNGEDVTVYGLFNEHFNEYQTLWNADGGRVYFYQSEMPYDPPSADAWKHGNTMGFASYKVSENVKSHRAWGLGIYNVFWDAPAVCDMAIEVPVALEDSIHHKVTFWLNGNSGSEVKSIINGKGGPVNEKNRRAVLK
jgi:hypothetical protein